MPCGSRTSLLTWHLQIMCLQLGCTGVTQGDVTMLEEDDLPPLVFSQHEAHTNIFCLVSAHQIMGYGVPLHDMPL